MSNVIYKSIDNISPYYEDQSYSEELFHVEQFVEYGITYDNSKDGTAPRTTPEIESEAKVFNCAVLSQAGYDYGYQGFKMYDRPLVLEDTEDPTKIANISVAKDKIIGAEKIQSYYDYLSNFEKTTEVGSHYVGTIRKQTPDVYNKIVKTTQENENCDDEDCHD